MYVMDKLTPKQEKFSQSVSEGMTLSDAYRESYPTCKTWKDESIHVRASELMKNSKVIVRVNYLKQQIEDKLVATTAYTLCAHLNELDEMKELALDKKAYVGKFSMEVEQPDVGTALRAVQCKGQVSGHYEKTLILQQFNTNINNITSIENITNNMPDLVFQDDQH